MPNEVTKAEFHEQVIQCTATLGTIKEGVARIEEKLVANHDTMALHNKELLEHRKSIGAHDSQIAKLQVRTGFTAAIFGLIGGALAWLGAKLGMGA